jgi:hypothetical protein
MSKPSSAPAAYTIPGTLTAEAIKERNELFRKLCEILSAIPGIVSALPEGITLPQVLTARPHPDAISLFSTFWGNLSNEQRSYINEAITDLFSKQIYARTNSLSQVFLWPGDGYYCGQDTSMVRHDGDEIIAPNLWLYLSLEDCHGSFYSVGLVKTYYLPWMFAIQVSIIRQHFSNIGIAQTTINIKASELRDKLYILLNEKSDSIRNFLISIDELEEEINILYEKFETMFHIHRKMKSFVKKNLIKTFGPTFVIPEEIFDIFEEQQKEFIRISDIININLKCPLFEIKTSFKAHNPPITNTVTPVQCVHL